ncbi:hypothetical protein AAH248_001548 [Klebsiella michiganensis]
MHDFMFFELSYKLSEILKNVTESTREYPSWLTELAKYFVGVLGVVIGFFLNSFKENRTKKKKEKKYLECIEWEVRQSLDISRNIFITTVSTLFAFKLKKENVALGTHLTIPTHCVNKFYPEIAEIINDDKRFALCSILSEIPFLDEYNKDVHSIMLVVGDVPTDKVIEKLCIILNRAHTVYQSSRCYLGEISKDEMISTDIDTTATHLEIHDFDFLRK